MCGMSLLSHFYFNGPLVTFMFGGLSYSACASFTEWFGVCVLFGWYHACWFVCSCVSVHVRTSAPSGEIGPRAAGYHPMHRALINWLRSGPEWAVNICLWRITHPCSLMCVKTGLFSWQRHSLSLLEMQLGLHKIGPDQLVFHLIALNRFQTGSDLLDLLWAFFERRKDPECRKQKRSWSNTFWSL